MPESRTIIQTPEEFSTFVCNLYQIEPATVADMLYQLKHSGNGQKSSFRNLGVDLSVAQKVMEAEYKITVGGTNVEIRKCIDDSVLLDRTDFVNLRGQIEDAIGEDGKVYDMKKVIKYLAERIPFGSKTFLDFAYQLRTTTNENLTSGGIILPNNVGNYVYKGHDLKSLKNVEITKIVSDITGAECSTLNDTIMGLLPDKDIFGILGTGNNVGYRKGGELINPESGSTVIKTMPNIMGLMGQEQPMQAMIAGGNSHILTPEDNWGIGGVYNVLRPERPVNNSAQVFERAEDDDVLAGNVLMHAAWWYETMIKAISIHAGYSESNPAKLDETGSVIKELRDSGYAVFLNQNTYEPYNL